MACPCSALVGEGGRAGRDAADPPRASQRLALRSFGLVSPVRVPGLGNLGRVGERLCDVEDVLFELLVIHSAHKRVAGRHRVLQTTGSVGPRLELADLERRRVLGRN